MKSSMLLYWQTGTQNLGSLIGPTNLSTSVSFLVASNHALTNFACCLIYFFNETK